MAAAVSHSVAPHTHVHRAHACGIDVSCAISPSGCSASITACKKEDSQLEQTKTQPYLCIDHDERLGKLGNFCRRAEFWLQGCTQRTETRVGAHNEVNGAVMTVVLPLENPILPFFWLSSQPPYFLSRGMRATFYRAHTFKVHGACGNTGAIIVQAKMPRVRHLVCSSTTVPVDEYGISSGRWG